MPAWRITSRRARSQSYACVSCMFSLLGKCRLLEDPAENRGDVAAKLFGVLAHRKMTELLHDGDAGAVDRGGRPHRVFRRAGKIIFTGEQIKRTHTGIDVLDPAAQIAIDPVEIQIALEDARPALHIGPQGFAA